ncbi:hypothetical protein O7606_16145 [Micromonospora sp. WMMD882]|uniref:hypothetical protein n=1 Tax=Micromonospora sp. WMMD882 TaxID=3015151 RepID=UPI00248AF6C1|nr:hypothetical protein [Micromonospora sp. WMMD882]WBB77800.1 hypothetical protein O7606_16145 [Micromonospora sp. WMMD882]
MSRATTPVAGRPDLATRCGRIAGSRPFEVAERELRIDRDDGHQRPPRAGSR